LLVGETEDRTGGYRHAKAVGDADIRSNCLFSEIDYEGVIKSSLYSKIFNDSMSRFLFGGQILNIKNLDSMFVAEDNLDNIIDYDIDLKTG
jgi:hypothetical protein